MYVGDQISPSLSLCAICPSGRFGRSRSLICNIDMCILVHKYTEHATFMCACFSCSLLPRYVAEGIAQ